jgi:hypothetical protein
MKDFNLLSSLLLISLILNIVNSQDSNLFHVADGTLNATAAVAFLNSIQGDNLYFLYDFDYHSTIVQNDTDIAYFEISSEIDLDDSISYTFVETKSFDIKNESEIKDLSYQNIKKDKINFYVIKRTSSKMNTLIFRVNTKGNKKGEVVVSNVAYLIYSNEANKKDNVDEKNNNILEFLDSNKIYIFMVISLLFLLLYLV